MIVKKRIILVILVLILIILITSATIFFLSLRENKSNPSGLIKTTNELITISTDKKTPESIQTLLNQLSDKKLSAEKKYNVLKDAKDYLSSVYNETQSPRVRAYIQVDLKTFAEKNYKKYYNPRDFEITCADPSCGEKIDPEMTQLIKDIEGSSMPQIYKDTIKYNLSLALLIPKEESQEKESGFQLVVFQLEGLGDPIASETAKIIRDYYQDKYGFKL